MRQTVDSVFKGLFLILLGLVFFANMYGFLPWNFWINVIDLWPLLLIFAGVALFLNKRIPFSSIMVVFLLALVGYSFIQGSPSLESKLPLGKVSGGDVIELSAPLEANVKKADLTLNLGGVTMDVQGIEGESRPGEVVNGIYEGGGHKSAKDPKFSYQTNGDTTRIRFDSEKRTSTGDSKLQLNLSDHVLYEGIKLNAGVVSGTMDFSRLRIEDLEINTGASEIELRFGDTGVATKVDLSTGATDLNLIVPENVGLKIDMNGIASETNFAGDGLILNSKDWVSPNYHEAQTKIEFDISMAAGKVNLERLVSSGDSSKDTQSTQTKTW
ncbi:MAG: LiaI-LiaF-like domain-containing protein [Desulfitobacterium sp.]